MAVVGDIAVVVAAYGMGSFPTAQLVGRRVGSDPTKLGSGNPGATNVYRTAGRRAGALVALGDVVKGALPAAIGLAVGGRPLAVAAWAAAVAGHVRPPIRRGGKGVATAAGGAVVLFPLLALAAVGLFAAIARVTAKVSVASLTIMVLMPVAVAVTGHPLHEAVATAAIAAVVVIRHRENIRRLVAGTEASYRR